MATTKVSALAETTSPQANDELLLNQSGVSKKVKVTNLGIGTPTDNSVTTVKIADDAVTVAKLNLISTSSVPSLEAKGDGNTQDGYIQLNCRDNSHGIKLKSPPHSASANYTLTFPNNDGDANQKLTTNGSGVLTWTDDSTTVADGSISTAKIADDAVTAAKLANSINTDIATGVTANTTANAALPKAGGTMTGNIAHAGNFTLDVGGDIILDADGAQIKFQDGGLGFLEIENVSSGNVILNAQVQDKDIVFKGNDGGSSITALTLDMSSQGDASFNRHVKLSDNGQLVIGDGDDLLIYHDGNNSYVKDTGDGDLYLMGAAEVLIRSATNENMIKAVANAQVNLYYDNAVKLATSANGVTVTGNAVGTLTTDNDGSFAMSASNNFKCTPAGNFALTFTAIVAQSGNILFINSGGHTISAHANTKVDANLLATISTAGTYLLSYFSDGTNVYMTNSAAYA